MENNKRMTRGDIRKTFTYGIYEIRQRVDDTAYPRNGNVHNPTVTYVYDIHLNGKRVDVGLPTLRKAKQEVDKYDAEAAR